MIIQLFSPELSEFDSVCLIIVSSISLELSIFYLLSSIFYLLLFCLLIHSYVLQSTTTVCTLNKTPDFPLQCYLWLQRPYVHSFQEPRSDLRLFIPPLSVSGLLLMLAVIFSLIFAIPCYIVMPSLSFHSLKCLSFVIPTLILNIFFLNLYGNISPFHFCTFSPSSPCRLYILPRLSQALWQ